MNGASSGVVFFPLACNAHSLVSGRSITHVRARLKIASLLYDRVLLESGQKVIQAGPDASLSMPMPLPHGQVRSWQTPRQRHIAADHQFSLTMSDPHEPGVPSQGPFREVLRSDTSICWQPTFEPFLAELPAGCDWIDVGTPASLGADKKRLVDRWKRLDSRNEALERLVPEFFVRSSLIGHVANDTVVGALAGWNISMDRLHGRVLAARLDQQATVRPSGFALPLLVPNAGELDWDDVAVVRRLSGLQRLREELREFEAEALELRFVDGDIETAIRRAYDRRVRAAAESVEGIRAAVGRAAAELVIGTTIGYATIGLSFAGPVAGGIAGATVTAVRECRRIARDRKNRAWIGAIGKIEDRLHSNR